MISLFGHVFVGSRYDPDLRKMQSLGGKKSRLPRQNARNGKPNAGPKKRGILREAGSISVPKVGPQMLHPQMSQHPFNSRSLKINTYKTEIMNDYVVVYLSGLLFK